MTWMRRVAPYLLAAVLIAFVVSLAYFGAGSSGGSGGDGRGRDGRRGGGVGGDLRPRVPRRGGADPSDGRRPLDGGAAPDAAPAGAGGRPPRRRAARRAGRGPRGHRRLRRRARRADHAHRRVPGGRAVLARALRAPARDEPAADEPARVRGGVPGGAGPAAPAGPDLRRSEAHGSRGAAGVGDRPEPGARGLPAGRGRCRRGPGGDRRRARGVLQGPSRGVHASRAVGGSSRPSCRRRACRLRRSPTPTSRRRTRRGAPSSSSRPARKSRTS